MPRDKARRAVNRVRVQLARQDGTPFPEDAGAGSAAFATIPIIVNLGSGRRSGSFDIDGLSSLVAGRRVLVFHSADPVPTKGGARDELEFDMVHATGYVVDATRIRIFWWAASIIVGDVAFAYAVTG